MKRLSSALKGSNGDFTSEKLAPLKDATNGKEAPPSYEQNDPVNSTVGPSPEELSAAFTNLSIASTPVAFPQPEHCLAHLKLLSAFHALKEDVGYTDGLFNLYDAKCDLVDNRDETLAKMREKRWALYIARAVERFEDWWMTVLCKMEPSKRLEGKEMVASNLAFLDFNFKGRPQTWTTSMLPPIGKNHFSSF